ncbi:hypothetical protein BH09BAC5_BH09BAC5_22320 [soil metagenome]
MLYSTLQRLCRTFNKSFLLSVLLLFTPFAVFSQLLPDSSIASGLGIKKLLILRYENNFLTDTERICILDHNWKEKDGIKLYVWPPENDSLAVRNNEKYGYVEFLNMKSPKRICYFDTVGFLWKYDFDGRLLEFISYSCEKGNIPFNYHYDTIGKLLSITCPPYGDITYSREDYSYDDSGRLISVVTWWTNDPLNPVRSKDDIIVNSISYSYNKNGLITDAFPFDPNNYMFWGFSPFEEKDSSVKVSFKYVYKY